MTRTEELFLELIRCALWDNEPVGVVKVDWENVIKLAERHLLLPLLADVILENNCQGLTTNQMNGLQKCIDDSASQYDRINSALFKLFDLFEADSIYPILLNDQVFAAFYNQPYLRQCSFVDLYVGEENRKRAQEILQKNNEGISVELIGKISCGTDSIKILERSVTVPEITYNLFYAFSNIWHQFMSEGICLRQLCDIAVFLDKNHYRIDEARFKNMLVSADLFDEWQLVVALLQDYLGLDSKKALFYKQINSEIIQVILENDMPQKEGWLGKIGRLRKLHKILPDYTKKFIKNQILHFAKR